MMNKLYWSFYTKATAAMTALKEDETGDTNFVSMMLIIGVVVVLAGMFLTLGTDLMQLIREKIIDFVNKL